MQSAAAVLRGLLETVWPSAATDGARAGGGGYLAPAWGEVRFHEAPWCDGCGVPFEHDRGPGVRCAACETRPRAFDRLRAACDYGLGSRDLILQFKHGDRLEHGRLFTRWLSRAGRELIADAELIAPVPLHPLRLLKRRYNQAAELARPLARSAGVVYAPDALIRTRRGGQAGRSASGRKKEAQGAFAVPEARRASVAGKRVLLIDDVLTTGATAEACARVLKRAGASGVDVLVVARVPDPRDVTI